MTCSFLIVDDSPLVRRSLRSLIEQDSAWQVCGEAENGKVAVEKVKALQPDIVILDLEMPVMNGLDAGREIARIAPKTAMVMFTMHCGDRLEKEAQAVGIKAVISKSDRVKERLLAVLKNSGVGT